MTTIEIKTPKVYVMNFYFPYRKSIVFAGYIAATSLQEAVEIGYNTNVLDARFEYLRDNCGYFPEGTQWELAAHNYHNRKETTHPVTDSLRSSNRNGHQR